MKAPTHLGTGSLRSSLGLGSTSRCPESRGTSRPHTGSRRWGIHWPRTIQSTDAWVWQDGNASSLLEAQQRECPERLWRGCGRARVGEHRGLDRCVSGQRGLHRFGRSQRGSEETGGELGRWVKEWASAWLTQKCPEWLKQRLWIRLPSLTAAPLPLSSTKERVRQTSREWKGVMWLLRTDREQTKRGWEKQDEEKGEGQSGRAVGIIS